MKQGKWIEANFDLDKCEWVYDDKETPLSHTMCSECHTMVGYAGRDDGSALVFPVLSPYCPWCGAKMENAERLPKI